MQITNIFNNNFSTPTTSYTIPALQIQEVSRFYEQDTCHIAHMKQAFVDFYFDIEKIDIDIWKALINASDTPLTDEEHSLSNHKALFQRFCHVSAINPFSIEDELEEISCCNSSLYKFVFRKIGTYLQAKHEDALEYRDSLNQGDSCDSFLLWTAIHIGNLPVVQFFFEEEGLDINIAIHPSSDETGLTGILWAAKSGQMELVQFFIDAQADVDTEEQLSEGWYPAVQRALERAPITPKAIQIAKLLIEHGAILDEPYGDDDQNLLNMYLSERDYTRAKILIKDLSATVDETCLENVIHSANSRKREEGEKMLQYLLQYNLNVNAPLNNGKTPIAETLAMDRGDLFWILVGKGANTTDVTYMDHVRDSLHSIRNQIHRLEEEPSSSLKRLRTTSSSMGSTEITGDHEWLRDLQYQEALLSRAKVLLESGATISQAVLLDTPPAGFQQEKFFQALQKGSLAELREVFHTIPHANFMITHEELTLSCLEWAVQTRNYKTVSYLVKIKQAFVDPASELEKGRAPIFYYLLCPSANLNGDIDTIAGLLSERGAKSNVLYNVEGTYETLLTHYIQEGTAHHIKMLLHICPDLDVNKTNEQGCRPIELALDLVGKSQHAETIVDMLCKKGADITYADPETGCTLLMKYASEGNIEVVKKLLAHKAPVDTQNIYGCTALPYALNAMESLPDDAYEQYFTIVRLLVSQGALFHSSQTPQNLLLSYTQAGHVLAVRCLLSLFKWSMVLKKPEEIEATKFLVQYAPFDANAVYTSCLHKASEQRNTMSADNKLYKPLTAIQQLLREAIVHEELSRDFG